MTEREVKHHIIIINVAEQLVPLTSDDCVPGSKQASSCIIPLLSGYYLTLVLT